MRGSEKITSCHQERTALIYIRQSTLAQVRENTESTARQYALADEAVRLGWASSRVEVIDADLGLSGRSAQQRSGFKDLVGRVCLGEVGAIFGLEVSRLARSSADLSRLLELARLTDTLVVDSDGIYDLANFNDRLLLGLKGTMSEAELHLLAGRLQGAKRAAAARGELRFPLPVGYVYDDEGATVVDPDQEVQAAVADLFAAFRAGGSAYQVVAAFKDRRFPLRSYGGVWAGHLRWDRLSHSRVLGVLANPAYAGVYVFGRYQSRRIVEPDGTVRTKTVQRPREEWPVVIHDHHPGYITWDDYLANQARLAANLTNAGARPPREGHALCQGIIMCGSCGRPMTVRYQRDRVASYECPSRSDHTTTPTCRSISAVTVDEAVAERLLEALNPEEIALALAAADEVGQRRARHTRAAELAVERARYEAQRAERAFHACEPENRLVARSLESRWEQRLVALAEAEKSVAETQLASPSLPSRAELETLTADVSALWQAPTTASRDRKRLLRSLIADVTLLPEPDLAKARIGIRWRTGATDELVVARRYSVVEYRRTEPAAVELVRRLGVTHANAELADMLNAQGFTTGAGRPFDQVAVNNLRLTHHIPPAEVLHPGEVSVSEIALRLGVNINTVYDWIRTGKLAARRGVNRRLCVPFDSDVEAACRDRVATSSQIAREASTDPPGPTEKTVREAAGILGISTDAVHYWIETGQLPARKGAGNRWLINFTTSVEATCRERIATSCHLRTPTKPQARRSTIKEAV